jgi:hypothetical protein
MAEPASPHVAAGVTSATGGRKPLGSLAGSPWNGWPDCRGIRIGDERNARIFRDIRTYHIGADELAELSADVGVGTLVLTHQVPSLPDAQAQQLFGPQIESAFDGELVVATDGTRVTIDGGS